MNCTQCGLKVIRPKERNIANARCDFCLARGYKGLLPTQDDETSCAEVMARFKRILFIPSDDSTAPYLLSRTLPRKTSLGVHGIAIYCPYTPGSDPSACGGWCALFDVEQIAILPTGEQGCTIRLHCSDRYFYARVEHEKAVAAKTASGGPGDGPGLAKAPTPIGLPAGVVKGLGGAETGGSTP